LLSAFGVVPGLLAGAWLSRVLESRLYGVGRLDGGTYVIGAVTLLVVVLVASWLPARRAMRVEPTVALRHE
jgi:putative ABC transport system permease protein